MTAKSPKRGSDPRIIFFYIFIVVLMLFFIVITTKIALSPICASGTHGTCTIDTWSIAGITAAIFGVAAALLAFLGAVAVAYWWADLDRKVDKQVEERTNELIEQRLQEQDVKFQVQIENNVKLFNELIEQRLQEQDVKLQAQITNKVKEFDEQIKGELQFIRKELVISAMLFPAWEVENWARELLLVHPSSEVAVRMVMSYLDEVDFLLPDPSSPKSTKWKTVRTTPTNDPLHYWGKALEWQEEVKRQNNQAYISNTEWQIEKRRPRIKEYQKQYPAKDEGNV